MPTVLSYPTGSVSSFLFETAKKFPSAPAILFEGKRISFSALCKEIDRVASGLLKKGIQSGDRVMICMPNIPQAAVLFYAVNRIGGVAVMAHPLLSAEELAHHMKESRVKAVCTPDLLEEKFRHLWPEKNRQTTDCGQNFRTSAAHQTATLFFDQRKKEAPLSSTCRCSKNSLSGFIKRFPLTIPPSGSSR